MTKKSQLAFITIFTIVIIASLVLPSLAQNPANQQTMKEIEYHYQLNPSGSLNATGKLSTGFMERTGFIEWENEPSYKQGFYIDTQDRYLKQNGMVLRVRFDIEKSKKSKITLKSRSNDINKLTFLGNGTKGEIDSFFGKDQYSFSMDTPIPSKEYDLNSMTSEDVLVFLKSNDADVYTLLKPLCDHMKKSPAIKTSVMRMAKFKGVVTQGPHKGMKVELQVWTRKNKAQPILAEIGFDGKTSNRKNLNAQDVWLSAKLKSNNLLAEDAGASKTELTFALGQQ